MWQTIKTSRYTIILLVVIVVVGAGAGWLFIQKSRNSIEVSQIETPPTTEKLSYIEENFSTNISTVASELILSILISYDSPSATEVKIRKNSIERSNSKTRILVDIEKIKRTYSIEILSEDGYDSVFISCPKQTEIIYDTICDEEELHEISAG